MRERIWLIASITLTLFSVCQADASGGSQGSTAASVETVASNSLTASGEQIKWHVVAGGGSLNASAGGFVLSATIGQTAATAAVSTAYKLNQGYWQNFSVACLCGDANGSGSFSISDVVKIINYIFSGGPAPNPLCLGDANGSGAISISDAVRLINYIFGGGPAPHC